MKRLIMSNEYFSDSTLVKAPPIKRAAYSDRTAWIMAELSRLVYDTLPCEQKIEDLFAEITASVKSGESKDTVQALIKKALQKDSASSVQGIEQALHKANFELLECYSEGGTEAFLAKLSSKDNFDGMLILAFRGTQPSIKDVHTDVKMDLIPAPQGGQVHKGFLEAYNLVAQQISTFLQKDDSGLPVYITGHSLGGALAMVATRYLESDSVGATYTYGCPRVADDEFYAKIKTPVYRIVNAADIVPRVPLGYSITIVLNLIRLIPFNGTRWLSEWLRKHVVGYTHYGTLVFLSAAPNVADDQGVLYKGLKVKQSPDFFWRMSVVVPRWVNTLGKAGANDHRIFEYSQKLLAYAQRRNRL